MTHSISEMVPLQVILVQAIQEFVRNSPLNHVADFEDQPIWDEPLVGFADGDDSLFDLYKEVVAEEHLTPRQALAGSQGNPSTSPHVSVVSWILPTAEWIRMSNRVMNEGPSLPWSRTRGQGETLNEELRRFVMSLLHEQGLQAVAPVLSEQFRRLRSQRGLASTWSERHAAYAAGLGTFSLSDGLITARGIAHRCGSVVTNGQFQATPRPYTQHQENCLHFYDGSCGECITRCPAGAIGPEGHDKDLCEAYQNVTIASWKTRPGYIGPIIGCGLCQTGVPCEFQIPARG